jgi:hypothetical protein
MRRKPVGEGAIGSRTLRIESLRQAVEIALNRMGELLPDQESSRRG